MTARRLLLATANQKKLVELQRILDASLGTGGVELVGLDAFPDYPDVPETGLTFGENALIKAREGASRTGLPTVADDSGLAVDALNGMPGVFSARWSGAHGDDQANLELVLGQIGDVTDEHRGGAFVCAAVLVLPNGREHLVEGKQRGQILRSRRGTGGFGYDPLVQIPALGRSVAELDAVTKNRHSHRALAAHALLGQMREVWRLG